MKSMKLKLALALVFSIGVGAATTASAAYQNEATCYRNCVAAGNDMDYCMLRCFD
jgi:hypothetical protein